MAKNANILLVANWPSDVGYAWWLMENFWATIADNFSNQETKCYLAYPTLNEVPSTITKAKIETIELDFGERSIKGIARIARFTRNYDISHIYFSDYPFVSLFYLWLRICGIQTIVIHDHTPGERSRPSAFRRLVNGALQRLSWISADHIIAVTDFVHERHLTVNCIAERKCSIARNGIVPLVLSNADRTYAHRQFGIPENRIIVVTTGRATYYKAIDFFIECANELVNVRGLFNLHFLYCGDGPDIGDFKRLAESLNVREHLTFAGSRTDIRDILPSCDIGIHMSIGEVGYSLSILEYMSAGLATIVSDNPSVSQAIVHGETGLCYPQGVMLAAADLVENCRNDPLRELLGNAAKNMIKQHYDIQQTNRSLVKALKQQFG